MPSVLDRCPLSAALCCAVLQAHQALMATGLQATAAPTGAGALGHRLAGLGISAGLFKAVGDQA